MFHRFCYPCHRRYLRVSLLLIPFACVGGCTPTGGIKITPVSADRTLEERVVSRDAGLVFPKIAIIDVSGLLVDAEQGGLFSEDEHPVSLLVEKLKKSMDDSDVKAVVLRINSPGGGVTASDLMHHELCRFRERTHKPVVAMLMDVAASGGYYIACAADEIVACPTTVTGSIGVIMQMVELSGTLDKLGITADAITSGLHKDSGSPLRKMRPEERKLFQTIVDAMYERFVETVAKGRPKLGAEQVRKLADGRVYFATQALENGLIDRIGTLEDAVALAKARAGIGKARVVMYERPQGWRPTWYADAPAAAPGATINIINLPWPRAFTRGPVFMYLWTPGDY